MSNPHVPFFVRATIHFRQCDPAGVLFFGEIFGIAHDAYEAFIQHLGLVGDDWFANDEWAVPIRHSACDYLAPMRRGETYDVLISLDRISESSFTARYSFEAEGRKHCEVSLVHAFYDKKKRSKMSVPSDIRARLEAYQRQS